MSLMKPKENKPSKPTEIIPLAIVICLLAPEGGTLNANKYANTDVRHEKIIM